MRALLVQPNNPVETFITEIDISDWSQISPNLGEQCRAFDCVRIDEGNTLYVDDEGLYNGAGEKHGYFAVRDYPQQLAGMGIIQGFDPDTGESTPCELTIEQAQQRIGILTPLGPIFRA